MTLMYLCSSFLIFERSATAEDADVESDIMRHVWTISTKGEARYKGICMHMYTFTLFDVTVRSPPCYARIHVYIALIDIVKVLASQL